MKPLSPSQICERYARQADMHVQRADLLELEASAKIRADWPAIRERGIKAATLARQHRKMAQACLMIVTNHTDYSTPSDNADLTFHYRLASLAYECRPTDTGHPEPMQHDPRFSAVVANMAA